MELKMITHQGMGIKGGHFVAVVVVVVLMREQKSLSRREICVHVCVPDKMVVLLQGRKEKRER